MNILLPSICKSEQPIKRQVQPLIRRKLTLSCQWMDLDRFFCPHVHAQHHDATLLESSNCTMDAHPWCSPLQTFALYPYKSLYQLSSEKMYYCDAMAEQKVCLFHVSCALFTDNI